MTVTLIPIKKLFDQIMWPRQFYN